LCCQRLSTGSYEQAAPQHVHITREEHTPTRGASRVALKRTAAPSPTSGVGCPEEFTTVISNNEGTLQST
jgi:hypothetical protein